MIRVLLTVLVYALLNSEVDCSNNFPVGCPLNTVKNGVIQIKNNNVSNCSCDESGDNKFGLSCLKKLDELHDKIKQQDYKLVNEILKKMCIELVNKVSPSSGETALLLSTRQSGYASYMISMKLIEYGADVNKVNSDGESPLINAIQGSNLPLVALLLLNGANIEGSDNNDLSPLFHSVMIKDIKMAHFLLKCGSSPNSTDRKGLTPLYYLLKTPMTSLTEDFFELLLDYGSSVTEVTLDGKDSVSFLISSGNKDLLEKLIEHPNFAKYIVRNNVQEEYLSTSERYSHNSTVNYVNKGFSNAKDKIIRIINAIKMGFGHKVLLSLIIPEVSNRNKDICLVKDEEGRTLIWWLTHYGDDELIRLLVNFYKVQSRSGVLEFEFCDLNEPDIYGNLPVGHIIYNFDSRYVVASNLKGEKSLKNVTESEVEIVKTNRLNILQDMLLFQNPRTNATLWYELVMNTNFEHAGEQKIVEYLSSSIIKFPVLSFLVRCFCVPLEKSSVSTPRSIPEIGTYEYDSVVSILSLLLLLNKNYASKVVLQSVLREAMLQSFWCIQALQHALVTATILGRDDFIRSILLGRTQTLSEVLSKLDYSSTESVRIASRLLGSIPPEFPNLDDLMLIPVTLLVRHIILVTDRRIFRCNSKLDGFEEYDDNEKNEESDRDRRFGSVGVQTVGENGPRECRNQNDNSDGLARGYFSGVKLNQKRILTRNRDELICCNNETVKSPVADCMTEENETELTAYEDQSEDEYSDDAEGVSRDLEKNRGCSCGRESKDCSNKNRYFKEEMRQGYFHESDTFSHLEVSSEYDSLLTSFEYLFSTNSGFFKPKTRSGSTFNGDGSGGIGGTRENEERCLYEKKQEVLGNSLERSLSGSFGLLKQFLSVEMTKFVRPESFKQTIFLLQNSTCNYPRGSEADLRQTEGDSSSVFGSRTANYFGSGVHSGDKAVESNSVNNNNIGLGHQSDHISDRIRGMIEEIEGVRTHEFESNDGTNKRHIFDIFYKNEIIKGTDFRPSNCLIELPSVCSFLIKDSIIWVPMIPKDQVYDKIAPTGTLTLNSQKSSGTGDNNDGIGVKSKNKIGWSIPTLTEEYQTIHLGFLPKIPTELEVESLGQLISSTQLHSLIKRNGNCGYATSYTTFDDLLTKKAKIISLLNSSSHHKVIPTITKTSLCIIATVLFYIFLWLFASYLRSLYINNMINIWSKKRLKKRNKARKFQLKYASHCKTVDKRRSKPRPNRLNALRGMKTGKRRVKKKSLSALHSLTIGLSKFIRKVLINLLPSSMFKLRDYANLFPSPEKKTLSDSLLLSLSIIFTSPWYVYEKKSNSINWGNFKTENRIPKSILLNAPMDYFLGVNSSVSNDFSKTFFKYLFFFMQALSLVYLFIVLLLIYEYEYIWFLMGLIVVSAFCTTVRIYYSFDFASNYCNKYFCGYSKDYYLYNYYYFKKNIKRDKNIKNIYSKLLGYASYRNDPGEGVDLGNLEHKNNKFCKTQTEEGHLRNSIRLSEFPTDKNNERSLEDSVSLNPEEMAHYGSIFKDSESYKKLTKSNTFPVKECVFFKKQVGDLEVNFDTLNEDGTLKYEEDSLFYVDKTESDNNFSLTNSSNNITSNFPNDPSSNMTLLDSLTSSPFYTSPSFSSITIENTQMDGSNVSSVNHNVNSSNNGNQDAGPDSESELDLNSKRDIEAEGHVYPKKLNSEKYGRVKCEQGICGEKCIIKGLRGVNSTIDGAARSECDFNNGKFRMFELSDKAKEDSTFNCVKSNNKRALSPILSSSSSSSLSPKRQKKHGKPKGYSLGERESLRDFGFGVEQSANQNSNSLSSSSAQISSSSSNSMSSPEEYRRLKAAGYLKYILKSENNSNCHSSTLMQSASSYNDYFENMVSRKRDEILCINTGSAMSSSKQRMREHINKVLGRIRMAERGPRVSCGLLNYKSAKGSVLGNRTDIRMNYRVTRNNNFDNYRNRNTYNAKINSNPKSRSSGGTIKLRKFKRLLSSDEERLSCDNIKTNLGNLITNNKIYKPLYRLVDEASYNSPFEYFSIVSICKVLSAVIALSSNICIVLFRTNSYLFRDSTLYFLYNRSPFTLYLVECIFIYWLSNLVFELMKGLIILLFFVRQRKRLCTILVQHIPMQFKYSNVQEFIQIVSYWRSAMQHILYKNTKLWTSFIDVFISINSLLLFSIGKLIFVVICNKKNKIFNSKLFDFSTIKAENKDIDSEIARDILDTGTDDVFISKNENKNLIENGVSGLSASPNSFSHYYYYGRHNSDSEFSFGNTNYNDVRLNDDTDVVSLGEEKVLGSIRSLEFDSGFRNYENIDKYASSYSHIGTGNPNYYFSSSTTENIVFSSIKSPTVSFLTSFIASKSYIETNRNNGIIGLITNEKFIPEFPNKYSNFEIIFLTLSIFMLVFLSFVIRLLYQVNRSSARTHSWLESIIHRTPPGAGIYIVIEKVLLVINSTPPTIKIFGFNVNERFSGFNLYVFTPALILIFIKFILF